MKITNLPCEIVAEILGQLDKVQDLKAPLLSCRLFHDAYTQRPRLAQQIIRKQVPKQLLPYAIVLPYASRVHISDSTYNALSLTPQDTDTMVFRFMLEGGVVSASKFQTFSLPRLMAMEATHELIIDVATHFAEKAWTTISDVLDDTISTKSTQEPAIHFEEVEKWYPARRILDALAPWDVEQMETAIGYLSDLFMASAKGLSANDISTDKWHCKGLRFLRNFEKMPSAEKREFLESGIPIFSSSLFMEFSVYSPRPDTSKAWQDAKLDVSLQLPNLADIDADEGPQKGLDFILDCAIIHGVSQVEYQRLRKQAYLFWDHERLQKYDMCSTNFIQPPFWGVNSAP
ncbi:hypothetical protein CFIO01_01879 [Colletotrichum fioriniae PJ7]|uniref:F-box domain-containing protein n=1 Tax=Colletotrichum fioriniae PJ7 TaxID=1445577 RepID=A0A010RWA4_9PEZI|nr:hypothetical protein CFIO01_01879 [Colletotrichum fioriniae PJ7]